MIVYGIQDYRLLCKGVAWYHPKLSDDRQSSYKLSLRDHMHVLLMNIARQRVSQLDSMDLKIVNPFGFLLVWFNLYTCRYTYDACLVCGCDA